MNAPALTPTPEAAALATAVEKANAWSVAARPIVKAIFALEDAEGEVLRGCDLRTYREAKPILCAPQRELRELLVGMREEFIADQMPPQPSSDAPEAEWDARDQFQDELEREVVTVDALVAKMVREA